jgi:ABC-type dipeptide/oligopeptide/nickel transport system permease component
MLKYILKRTFRSFVTLFIIITIVFSLLRLMPIEGYFNNFDKLTPTQIRVGLENLGLNRPLPVQLFNFYKQLLKGDLGLSYKYRVRYPIADIIGPKMGLSLRMGLMATAIEFIIGFPLGIMMAHSAKKKNHLFDRFGMLFVVLMQAVPGSIYHLLIQIYGTGALREIINLPTLFQAENYATWILPVISLSLYGTANYAMWLRRFMVDESNKDYVQLALAKGVPPGTVARRHIFRNAIVPLIQYIPGSILFTLMGSLYVESLYSIPGMGGLLVDVIKRQDNTMVQALVLIYAGLSIFGLLLGDILMALVDPRITLSAKKGSR